LYSINLSALCVAVGDGLVDPWIQSVFCGDPLV
jgi:hypothetical protein